MNEFISYSGIPTMAAPILKTELSTLTTIFKSLNNPSVYEAYITNEEPSYFKNMNWDKFYYKGAY